MYSGEADLDNKIYDVTIQGQASRLLDVWHNNQFACKPRHIFELFRRVARAIPLNRDYGGFAPIFKYVLRTTEDPRFADRRMQSLLQAILDNLHHADPSKTSQILYSVVKLRFPCDELTSALVMQAEE